MPREIPKPVKPTVVDNSTTASVKECQSATRQQTDYSDLKLKTLSENIAKLYVPFALKDSESVEDITIDNLSNEAYLYIDDNGKPTKIVATTVLRKEIRWEDLSEEVRNRLQELAESSSLVAGDHIRIQNGIISADVGVESINGKTGVVNLTPEDIGAASKAEAETKINAAITYAKKSEVYTKTEAATKADLASAVANLEITIDGGRIE